jgi:hypothetical protein
MYDTNFLAICFDLLICFNKLLKTGDAFQIILWAVTSESLSRAYRIQEERFPAAVLRRP